MSNSLTNWFLNAANFRFGDDPGHGNDDLWPSNNSGGHSGGGSSFQKYYECLSSTYAFRDDVEAGNKILLPSSALGVLARQDVAWPMLFELSNTELNKQTHCGVLEFSAEEGKCILPMWLMKNLQLENGQLVRVTSVALPKGTFVKLQPTTSDFLDLSNHRAVLENSLRHYACVTVGDHIQISHNEKIFEVEILETKPSPAISVIETDLEVDFAPPKDYVEPKPVFRTPKAEDGGGRFTKEQEEGDLPGKATSSPPPVSKLFAGDGQRLDGTRPGSDLKNRSEEHQELTPDSSRKKNANKLEPWLNALPGGVHRYNEIYARRFGGGSSRTHAFRGLGSRIDDNY